MDGIDSRLEGDHRQRKASILSRGSHFNAEAPTATPWLQCGGRTALGYRPPPSPLWTAATGRSTFTRRQSQTLRMRGTRTGNLRRAVEVQTARLRGGRIGALPASAPPIPGGYRL